jgi:hypothetical protein
VKSNVALFIVSLLYISVAAIATIVAIVRNLPQDLFGMATGQSAAQEFITLGTAISPPVSVLILQLLLTFLVTSRQWWGTVGVVALGLLGILYLVAGAGEPIVGEVFAPDTFDFWLALLVTLSFLLAASMVILAVMELVRRSRKEPEMEKEMETPVTQQSEREV